MVYDVVIQLFVCQLEASPCPQPLPGSKLTNTFIYKKIYILSENLVPLKFFWDMEGRKCNFM